MPGVAEEIEDKDHGSSDPNAGRVQEPQGLSVDLTPEDPDDDDSPKGQAESRKGRRAQVRELREKLESESTARTRLEREVSEMRGRLSAIQQAPREPTRADESDPLDAQIEGIESQKHAMLIQLRAGDMTEARAEEIRKQYRKLDKDQRRLEFKQLSQEGGQGEAPASRTEHENLMLSTEFPEVFGDEVRLGEAKVELMKLCRAKRVQPNYALAKQAAKMVSDKYARKVPQPTDADRARYASEPSRAGAGGGVSRFSPNKGQLAAARAYTSHLEGISDEERVKIWATKVGKPNKLI